MNFIRKFFSPVSPEAMSAAKDKAQKIINENAVAVFSKSYCPYCNASKQLLNSVGAKYFTIELDKVDDGPAIQSALQEISGQRTVPNIYIGQKHIGGNSDLQAKSGELKTLLKEVGALEA
ncbi:putative glutaredoxin [Xylaria curta]|nr:putative glutaredoxin [Xylaria curta]